MGGVTDGQAVNASVTNSAFLEKNGDDSTQYKLGLQKASGSGPILYDDIQLALNTLDTASGSTQSVPGTVYSATPSTVADGDNYQTAVQKLANKFDPVTGHTHSGAAGDGPMVSSVGFPKSHITSVTLTDNSGPTLLTSVRVDQNVGFWIDYVITRGTNFRVGKVNVITDGTTPNSAAETIYSEIGDCGITWTVNQQTIGGHLSVVLSYTTTSTGTNAKISYDMYNYSTP